jgi:hypothetical protein
LDLCHEPTRHLRIGLPAHSFFHSRLVVFCSASLLDSALPQSQLASCRRQDTKRCNRRHFFWKGASAPASFMGYAYVIQGKQYAGFFALYGDEVHVQDVQDSLPGTPLPIRYNPSDPNISCLLDFNDMRFAGLTATQNPEWLDQARVRPPGCDSWGAGQQKVLSRDEIQESMSDLAQGVERVR